MANLKVVKSQPQRKTLTLANGVDSSIYRKYSHGYAVVRALENLGPATPTEITKEVVRRRLMHTTMKPKQAVTWMVNCLLREGTIRVASAKALKAAA